MSDYGDEIEWDDAAETQLANLEAGTPFETTTTLDNGQPSISIQTTSSEQGTTGSVEQQAADARSLWQRFRQRRGWGSLSVSDLVGPSWCEQQTCYRLQAKSHLRPDKRPAEIVTESGASITVDQKRTAARDIILDKGKAVHRDLEKQAMGDEVVPVTVQSKEDWWALRVLNTIIALDTLLETGLAREIPVVGFVDDFLVLGVVDEVIRKARPKPPPSAQNSSTKNAKKKVPAVDTAQQKLDNFFAVSSNGSSCKEDAGSAKDGGPASNDKQRARHWAFFLVDAKTRYNRSLPPDAESKPSKLQLMLYHRLLSSMLGSDADTAFDWARLARMHGLNLDADLSEAFRTSIAPLVAQSVVSATLASATSLRHFIEALKQFGALLGADDPAMPLFEPLLSIQYRLRQNTGKWKPRKKSRRQQEEEDLQRAIAESLQAQKRGYVPDKDEEDEVALALALALADQVDGSSFDADEDVKKELVRMAKLNDDVNPVVDDLQPDQLMAGLDDMTLSSVDRRDESGSCPPVHSSGLALNSQAQASNAPALRYNLRPRLNRHNKIKVKASSSKRERSISDLPPPPSPPVETRSAPASPQEASTSKVRTSSSSSSPEQVQAAGTIIGTIKFRTNPQELDSWLEDVIKLWKSERPPRGVSLEQTKRCRTCEFEDGCEWRINKALEIADKARAANRK
ncbi:hypothetical protein ACM66B_002699 [Microbotryomycetes sp. NB124-2]